MMPPGMIDEVDLVLHPLRSELNFPIGPKNLIEHAPVTGFERWFCLVESWDVEQQRKRWKGRNHKRTKKVRDTRKCCL